MELLADGFHFRKQFSAVIVDPRDAVKDLSYLLFDVGSADLSADLTIFIFLKKSTFAQTVSTLSGLSSNSLRTASFNSASTAPKNRKADLPASQLDQGARDLMILYFLVTFLRGAGGGLGRP
jgi:hypothetical protein